VRFQKDRQGKDAMTHLCTEWAALGRSVCSVGVAVAATHPVPRETWTAMLDYLEMRGVRQVLELSSCERWDAT
jgi:hypothetical protein